MYTYRYYTTEYSCPPSSGLSPLMEKVLSGDVKKLYEAGYLDSNLEFTDLGRDKLDAILFEKFKKELLDSIK